jgi:hypothetical protein
VVVSLTSAICPSRARVSLISSKYHTWCRSTSEPCRHDLTHAFMYLPCLVIQENVIFDRAKDQFSLEVLTPMGDVILNVGIWKSSFSFRAPARVAGPRRSSKDVQHKQSYEAQSESTRCYVVQAWKEKWQGWLRSSPLFNCLDTWYPSCYSENASFIILVPAPSKSPDKISFF